MASNPGLQPSTPYESKPPELLPKATRDGDLGYHGFYPPKPGQDEEILSETNIKYGYTEPHLFGTELWPGTDTFISAFKQDSRDGLNSLQELMEKVMARRSELYAVVENTPLKLPSRMTMAGDKKTQWYEKLADPDVPLHEITQISHGTKNADGIEIMYANKLPVDRAFWYFRALGAIEIKNKGNNGAQHTAIPEWTTALTSYLKRQLAEIAMPAVSRTGANIKQVFKRTKLSDAEGRDAWVDKFAYTLELLRCFSDCGLLDQSSFLTWLVTTAGIGEGLGPHQFIFIMRIVDEYFNSVASNRVFATPIIEACLARYLEIQSSPGRQHASCILEEISSLILRFFRANEDLFVNRNIVANHAAHLQDLLLQAIQQLDPDVQSKLKEDTMARYHHLVERLRSIFSIQLPADEDTLEVKSRLADIAILNSIDITTDLASFQFLPTPAGTSSGSSDSRPFASRLSILLTWAITLGQAGDPTVRPYIATTLILAWKAQALRTIPNVNQFLQRQLLSWLEEKDLLRPYMHQGSMVPPSKGLFWRRGANAAGEMEAIALLFGDLVHRKLFSFSDYLTRMTSFGQGSAPSPTKTDSSMDSASPKTTAIPPPDHLELLRHLPLWDRISEQLLNQRKIVLYGIRARKTVEDAMEKEIRAEIRRVVPLFFNGPPMQETFSRDLLPQALAASKFVQARVIHHWLFDLVKDHISRTSASSALAQRSVLPLSVYNTLTRIFSWTGCFLSLFELNNLMLNHALDDDVLVFTLRSISRHFEVWVRMARVERIVEVLLETYRRLREQTQKSPKSILALLHDIDHYCILSLHLKESIQVELSGARKILLSDSYSSSPAPPILPFINAALEQNSLEQPADVGTTIWYKNHAHADWGMVSWQAMVVAVGSRAWDPSVPDRTMVERFTSLASCIDAHLPDGIKDIVRVWFETAGAERMMGVSDEEWHMMEQITLSLSSSGTLSPEIVLNGLVFPVWNHAYRLHGGADYSQALARTLPLASTILLCDPLGPEGGENIGILITLEVCRTRTTRPSNFPAILRGTHALAVFEQDEAVESNLKHQIRNLRQRLVRDAFMQNQIFSRTSLLQEVFEEIATENPGKRTTLVASLRECLRNEWDMSTCERTAILESLTELKSHPAPITAAQWTRIFSAIDLWSFSWAKLNLQLFLEQLHQKSLDMQREGGGDLPLDDGFLESLALVLSEGKLSSSRIALTAELVRGSEAALRDKIARHGLEQLSQCLASSESDDPVAFVAPAKELLRLIITFRRTEVSPHPFIWPTGLQDQFLRNWMERVSALQQCVRGTGTDRRDYNLQEVADVICFMMRVLHFFSELFGPDLGSKIVPAISSIIQLAVMFGGSITLDEITFSMLIDTACILIDDCPREVKQQVHAALGQVVTAGLPAHLPSPSRYRLDSILPFNPHDKTVSNLGQAHRINGDLEFTSAVRNQSWEWMDSVEASEPSTVLSTRIRNTAAMRLELFETTSKGESILSDKRVAEMTKQGGDVWILRDSAASEGLLARAWRESRTAAWDVKSVDESITSASRALSPAASRSSAHMSTSSRRGSPSINMRGHPASIPTVETVDAEPLVESRPARGLKRKARVDEEEADLDIVMVGERRAATKTTQSKRGKGKGKSKR